MIFSAIPASPQCLDPLQFLFPNILPRALGMFLGTAHARSQVLQTVHVEAPTAITRRHDLLAPLQLLHPRHHMHLVRATVVLLLLGGSWRGEKRRRRARDRNSGRGRRVHIVLPRFRRPRFWPRRRPVHLPCWLLKPTRLAVGGGKEPFHQLGACGGRCTLDRGPVDNGDIFSVGLWERK